MAKRDTANVPDEAVEVVKARRFELVDDQGDVFATFVGEPWPEGGTRLVLRSAAGVEFSFFVAAPTG